MPVVTLPDGRRMNFPEGSTPEFMQKTVDGFLGVTPEVEEVDTGLLRGFGRGVKRGALGVAQLPLTAAEVSANFANIRPFGGTLAPLGGALGLLEELAVFTKNETIRPTRVARELKAKLEKRREVLQPDADVQGLISDKFKEEGLAEALKLGFNPRRLAFQLGEQGTQLAAMFAVSAATGGSAAAAGLLGGALEGQQTLQTARELGATPAQQQTAFFAMTAAAGALNKIGYKAITARIPLANKSRVLQTILAGITEGGTEYLEEPAELAILESLGFERDWAAQLKAGLDVLPISIILGGATSFATELQTRTGEKLTAEEAVKKHALVTAALAEAEAIKELSLSKEDVTNLQKKLAFEQVKTTINEDFIKEAEAEVLGDKTVDELAAEIVIAESTEEVRSLLDANLIIRDKPTTRKGIRQPQELKSVITSRGANLPFTPATTVDLLNSEITKTAKKKQKEQGEQRLFTAVQQTKLQEAFKMTPEDSTVVIALLEEGVRGFAAQEGIAPDQWVRDRMFIGEEFLVEGTPELTTEEIAKIKEETGEEPSRGEILAVDEAKNPITTRERSAIKYLWRALHAPDFSTSIHEMAHFLDLSVPDAGPVRAAMDKIIRKGKGKGAFKPRGEWTTADHETFAEQVETFWLYGEAPTKRSAKLFAFMKKRMTQIHSEVKDVDEVMGSTGLRMSLSMIFDTQYQMIISKRLEFTDTTVKKELDKFAKPLHLSQRARTSPQHMDSNLAYLTSQFVATGVITEEQLKIYPDLMLRTSAVWRTVKEGKLTTKEEIAEFLRNIEETRHVLIGSKLPSHASKIINSFKSLVDAERLAKLYKSGKVTGREQEQALRLAQEGIDLDNDPNTSDLDRESLNIRFVRWMGGLESKSAKNFFLTQWYISMLSGTTMGQNFVGNTAMFGLLTSDKLVGGGLEFLQSLVNPKMKRQTFAWEGFTLLRNLFTGAASLPDAAKVLFGQKVLASSPGGQFSSALFKRLDIIQQSETKFDEFVGHGTMMGYEAWATSALEKLHVPKSLAFLTVRGTNPLAWLHAVDIWFKAIYQNANTEIIQKKLDLARKRGGAAEERLELNRLVAREAELPSRKDIGTEMRQLREDTQKKKGRAPTIDEEAVVLMDVSSSRVSETGTFQTAPGPLTEDISNLRTTLGPIGKLVMPFIQVQANVLKTSASLLPIVGIGTQRLVQQRKRVMDIDTGETTTEKLRTDYRQIMVRQVEGLILGLIIWTMVQQGKIRGRPPRDKGERDAMFRRGEQPFSFIVDGVSVSYRSMEPFALSIGMIASLYEDYKDVQESNLDLAKKELEAYDIALRLSSTAGEMLLNSSYMQGLTDSIQGEASLDRQLKRTTTSFIPYSGFWRTMRRSYEEATTGEVAILENESYMDMWGESSPKGLVAALEQRDILDNRPKVDAFGKEIKRKSVSPFGFLKEWIPVRFQPVLDDPVENELVALSKYIGFPQRVITYKKGKKFRLFDDDYREYTIQVGIELKKRLHGLVTRPSYRSQSTDVRANALDGVIKKVRARELRKIKRKVLKQIRQGR